MRRSTILLFLWLPTIGGFAYVIQSTPQLPDPGNTGVSKEQQNQLGEQTAAEVYKQMPVLPDSEAPRRSMFSNSARNWCR